MLNLTDPIIIPSMSITRVNVNLDTKSLELTVAIIDSTDTFMESHILILRDGDGTPTTNSTGIRLAAGKIVEEFVVNITKAYTDCTEKILAQATAEEVAKAAEEWTSGAGILPPGTVS